MGGMDRSVTISLLGLIGSLPVLVLIYLSGQCPDREQSASKLVFLLFMYTQLPLLFLLPHHWMVKAFALCVVATLSLANLDWTVHTLQDLRSVACSKMGMKGVGVTWGLAEWAAAPANALLLVYLPIQMILRAYQKRLLANE